MEKPMLLRNIGITGYNISLEMSVNKLTSDSIQTGRVIIRFLSDVSLELISIQPDARQKYPINSVLVL